MSKAKTNGTKIKQAALPKGFKPARQRLDGFFAREKGNSITGILRGAFETRGRFGPKQVFRIEVTEGETQIDDGEMAGPGAFVGVDETGYTRALGDVATGTGIFLRYEGKGDAEKDPHVFSVGVAE